MKRCTCSTCGPDGGLCEDAVWEERQNVFVSKSCPVGTYAGGAKVVKGGTECDAHFLKRALSRVENLQSAYEKQVEFSMNSRNELEKLRKHMTYFRAFARNVRTIAMAAGVITDTKRLEALRKDIRLVESQWPDWLLEGIEGMLEEELIAAGKNKEA